LHAHLPQDFLSSLPSGVELSYAAITQIRSLPQPVKDEVRNAFADSLDVLWEVMIGVAGLGLLSCLLMREIPMQLVSDENWGINKENNTGPGAAPMNAHA
jgi:hypothetical protein